MAPKKPSKSSQKRQVKEKENDREEDEEQRIPDPPPNGSGSESDSDDSPSKYQVQPISKPAGKRTNPDDTNNVRSSKKPKSETPVTTRLWSNEDEITVLKGMDEFKNRKGSESDPNWDLGAFQRFIEGNLQGDYSKEQLRCKIKNMKKRFLNAAKKCGEDGSDPVFSKPHEHLSFALSKKIWGGVVDKVGESHEANAKKDEEIGDVVDEEEKDVEEGGSFLLKFPFLSASFDNVARNYPSLRLGAGMAFVKENLSLIGSETAKEFDDKWKQLLKEEMEIKYKMATFVRNLANDGV